MPAKDPEYHRKYYERNKERIRDYNLSEDVKERKLEHQRRRAMRVYEYLRKLKEETPCADCKERYPHYVMDFDHVRGQKRWDLAKAPRYALSTVEEEVAKCELVCANCHRTRTWQRANS